MKRVAILASALVLSTAVFATTSFNLASSIVKSLQNNSNNNVTGSLPIIYGGQDIARSDVAMADVSVDQLSKVILA